MVSMRRLYLPMLSAGCSALAASAAFGQGLEEIIVTAQKREERLQDVPISMTVVTQQQLEAYNTSDFKSLSASVPGMFVQHAPGNDGLFLRGFGTFPNNPSGDQEVTTYVDGIYGGRARQFMSPFFDVERIEVLRGAQGALLGKNTAAGAVSIITAKPTRDLEGSATVAYNFSRPGVDAFGYVSGPVADKLSARLAVKYTNIDGYITNVALNRKEPQLDNKLVRLTGRYESNGSFVNTLKFQYDNNHTDGSASLYYFPTTLPLSEGLETAVKNTPAPFGLPITDDLESYNLVNTADIGFGDGYTLSSITGFSTFNSRKVDDLGDNNPSLYYTDFPEYFSQVSQEFRVTSPSGRKVDFLAGAYVDRSTYKSDQTIRYAVITPPQTGMTTINFGQNAWSYSFYANATWRVLSGLRLVGSGRYTWIRKHGRYLSTVVGTPFNGAVGRGPVYGLIEDSTFDPSVTVQYDVKPNVMVYASFARGSKSGGFDSLSRTVVPASFTTRGERSTNYEIGAKTTFVDWLTLDLDVYRINYKDLQVPSFDPVLLQNIQRNAASARSQGVEWIVTVRASEELTLSATGNYMDAYYLDFPGASCAVDQPVPPCTARTNNLAGYPLQGAAHWSGEVAANYTTPITSNLKITLNAAVNYRSDAFILTTYARTYGLQPAHAKLNARLELAQMADRWALALIGKNLTNKLTSTQSFLWTFVPPLAAAEQLDETRTISLQGTYRF